MSDFIAELYSPETLHGLIPLLIFMGSIIGLLLIFIVGMSTAILYYKIQARRLEHRRAGVRAMKEAEARFAPSNNSAFMTQIEQFLETQE